jgi:hypothetical protein
VVTAEAKRSKAAADSAKRTERMFRAFGFEGIRLTRPGKAALLAAVLPGAGQIYNRRWWKLPLVYGSLGGVVYGEIFYQGRYRCMPMPATASRPKQEQPEASAHKAQSLTSLFDKNAPLRPSTTA